MAKSLNKTFKKNLKNSKNSKNQKKGAKRSKKNKRVNKKSLKKGGGNNNNNEIVYSGYLRKQGGRPFFRWDTRWFELSKNGFLKYYDKEGGNLKGMRDITNCEIKKLDESVKKTDGIYFGFAINLSKESKLKTKNRGREGEFRMHVGNVDNGLQEMIKWILKISCLSRKQICASADELFIDNLQIVPHKNLSPVITFQSNCNSELSSCYDFNDLKNSNTHLTCKPLYDILSKEIGHIAENKQEIEDNVIALLKKIKEDRILQDELYDELQNYIKILYENISKKDVAIYDKVYNQILKKSSESEGYTLARLHQHPNFLGEGSFNAAYKLVLQNSPEEKKVVLRLTHNNDCDTSKNELVGLYYQTKISKDLTDGGLGCENVCKVYDFGKYDMGMTKLSFQQYRRTITHPDEGVYAFIEYLPGGELFERIIEPEWDSQSINIKIKKTKYIIRQLLEALKCIHSAGYVHLDLKPENIMCVSKDNDNIKLIDFGLMRKKGTPRDGEIGGSPKYLSIDFFDSNKVDKRELMKKMQWREGITRVTDDLYRMNWKSSKEYDERYDIWSVGIIIWDCIFGRKSSANLNSLVSYGPDIRPTKLVLCPSDDDYIKNKCPLELKKFLEQRIFTPLKNRATAKELLEDEFLLQTDESDISPATPVPAPNQRPHYPMNSRVDSPQSRRTF